jgi:hypothetical protein
MPIFLEKKLLQEIPLILILEFIYTFFSTNNTYRFHIEMQKLYHSIDVKGMKVLKVGFVSPYLLNLIQKYGSLDWIESKKGLHFA